MKLKRNFSKQHFIPVVIGLVFLISLVVVLVTTFTLRKELVHEESIQLAGKYKDRFGATFVGSETCKKCHERTYLEWKTSLHSRMMHGFMGRNVFAGADEQTGIFNCQVFKQFILGLF